ncbi:lysophospholipid acyltransferase family protein [Nonomuraea rosea]|uniref:Lysophospholipid acyltransferase family protein n=1 Tax=Nonomuraea rosea TaxID=638574 RepID=A0ABP6X009_9ACTN
MTTAIHTGETGAGEKGRLAEIAGLGANGAAGNGVAGGVAAAAGPWRPVSPCSPDACLGAPAALAGPVHRVARLLAAVLVVLAGLPLSLAATRTSPARQAAITRAWARTLLHALGVEVRVTAQSGGEVRVTAPAAAGPSGVELRVTTPAAAGPSGGGARVTEPAVAGPVGGGVLVVANHVSWLDPLVIAATVPSRPLAKREVAAWPVVGRLTAASGALFIDRDRLSALPAAVETIANALRAGHTVAAFPEGTTWCGRGMGRFRPAVFQAALDAGAEIRPVTLRYREGETHSTRPSFVGDDSLLASALRVTATRGLVAEVVVLAPIRHRSGTAGKGRERAALAGIAESRVRARIPESHPA